MIFARTITCLILMVLLTAASPIVSYRQQSVVFGVVPSANQPTPQAAGAGQQLVSGNGAGAAVAADGQSSVVNSAPAPFPAQPCGVLVKNVLFGSPADLAGLRQHDVLLNINGLRLHSPYQLRSLLSAMSPGTEISVLYLRNGEECRTNAVLSQRSCSRMITSGASSDIRLTQEFVQQVGVLKSNIRRELAKLPEGMDAMSVVNGLQALRNLAASLSLHNGWMAGQACDATIEFRDVAGRLVLHGANNNLVLSVYSDSGKLLYRSPLNTPHDCLAVPPVIIRRLKTL